MILFVVLLCTASPGPDELCSHYNHIWYSMTVQSHYILHMCIVDICSTYYLPLVCHFPWLCGGCSQYDTWCVLLDHVEPCVSEHNYNVCPVVLTVLPCIPTCVVVHGHVQRCRSIHTGLKVDVL